MMNGTRTNQGGSVASYIIVGVVLLLIVVGAIYTLHKRSDVVTTPNPGPSVALSTSPSGAPSAPQASSPAMSPSPTPSSTPAPAPSKPVSPAATPPLPTTGPSDNIGAVIMGAVLVGLSVAYARSRRAHVLLEK